MRFVRLRSWHAIWLTYRGGAVKTRCGRTAIVQGTIAGGIGPVRPTADVLPSNERTCETCLKWTVRDIDAATVANDEVPG